MTSPTPDPGLRSATELVSALERGEVSSVELLDHFLGRIDRLNPAYNAVVALDVERAREQAAEIDDARIRGDHVGPLAGIPMTVKDAFETQGLVTTSGAPELATYIPKRDADAVVRLRRAGAVIFGKTNLPRYAGDVQTFNDVHGRTNNPWDVERTVGGSSGGAAAALAAGLTGLELGSDLGGSIRQPAHFCGVFGLKPTYDLVPVRGHIPGPPGTLSIPDVVVAGPLGRSVDDLELALDVIAGPTGPRSLAYRLELAPPRATRLADLRFTAWLDEPSRPLAADVAAVLRAAVDRIADAGARFVDRRPPTPFADLVRLFERTAWGDVGALSIPDDIWPMIVEVADSPGPDDRLSEPSLVRSGRAAAQRHRDRLQLAEENARTRMLWDDWFGGVDIVLAPVVDVAAFPHDTGPSDPTSMMTRTIDVDGRALTSADLMHWCGVFGVLHLPAVAIPAGRTAAGLPVGIQVIGARYHDRTALAAARTMSEVLGGFEPPPPVT